MSTVEKKRYKHEPTLRKLTKHFPYSIEVPHGFKTHAQQLCRKNLGLAGIVGRLNGIKLVLGNTGLPHVGLLTTVLFGSIAMVDFISNTKLTLVC